MANSNSRKIKLLKIWEILSQNTDEKNPMPTPVLIERLSEYGNWINTHYHIKIY